ncbi:MULTISPECIES: sensor domain-containing diguanylate cyclase [unclassified Pseudomonas]|jgi:diguanylate cyclase (GGDEF)-like protein|uniref:GGDEF domain-containing protein n=1 Tax=unclassified Pseudomonas TaxID=196821 RepID=UPI00129E321C|nr:MULTISPECIES: sensor domain-containing diguanylate cyclase [unclassified Pseudomonas]MDH4655276.1 sensor domain-containing diguanylate cyclase [Pseudomonas sp. BN606]MRK20210.1 sensor domain-containing diguanylate cyclase [Pseudomonas sp. JG-B]
MLAAPCHPDEKRRLLALQNLEVLDTPAEHYLDTLVRLTRDLFNVATVLISLIDRDRQWFKARIGLEASETPRNISFCGHAILQDDLLLVEDARRDPRFADNPLVLGPPYLRFYAGQPIYSSDGQPIGTLCLLDPTPRPFSRFDRTRLHDLATLAQGYLQMRMLSQQTLHLREAVNREQRKAQVDPLTQLWNRSGFNQLFPLEQAKLLGSDLRLGVIYCDLDHFKKVNDQHGHAAGDQVLWESARRMSAALRPQDLLARLGGEEFVALVAVHEEAELMQVAERLRRAIEQDPIALEGLALAQTASFGATLVQAGDTQANVLDRADRGLYLAKQNGRNRVEYLARQG